MHDFSITKISTTLLEQHTTTKNTSKDNLLFSVHFCYLPILTYIVIISNRRLSFPFGHHTHAFSVENICTYIQCITRRMLKGELCGHNFDLKSGVTMKDTLSIVNLLAHENSEISFHAVLNHK